MSCVLILLMSLDVVLVVVDLSSRDASTPPFIFKGDEITSKITESATT
jgi:hypothetical protein